MRHSLGSRSYASLCWAFLAVVAASTPSPARPFVTYRQSIPSRSAGQRATQRNELVDYLAHYRTGLQAFPGSQIDILIRGDQGRIFGTKFFRQFIHLRIQLIGTLSLLVILFDLITELDAIAIGVHLVLVTADYSEDLLRVLICYSALSLCPTRRCGDQQNGSNQLQLHEGTSFWVC